VTLLLTDSSYTTRSGEAAGEVFPIVINSNPGASATNTLTIKPAPAITAAVTGSSATALITLNGADWVTIDGSNTAGGTTRNLTLTNTNVSTTSAVIWGQTIGTGDPAANDTIKNCILTGNAPTTTLIGVGFGSSTISATSLGSHNDNNRIQNNQVTSAQYGIVTNGVASNFKNVGTVINGNDLGGAGTAVLGRQGIMLGFDDGAQVTNNRILGVGGSLGVQSLDAIGIGLGTNAITNTAFTLNNDVANVTVSGNFIGPVVRIDTFSAAGIAMGTNNYGTSRIFNKMVYGVIAIRTPGN
jgi:hypothetical protein